jgi:hypothetical protein
MKASPLSSILKNSSPEQYHNIINHHNHTSPTTHTSNQTETKYLSSLKILTLNVRSVLTSQHDLKHMIATNTPDIMVLTETKLQKGNKRQPWLHQLLTNYKWWTSTNKNGGTTVCVSKCIALKHKPPALVAHQKHKPPALRCKPLLMKTKTVPLSSLET